MSFIEHRQFSHIMARHSAPTLLGIKCGSLFSLDKNAFSADAHIAYFNARAAAKGLKIRILCHCGKRSLLYVYNEALLQKRLAEPWAQALLASLGYAPQKGVAECLRLLAERIGGEEEFPHEIGVFLGYPKEDVEGFLLHKGADSKLCGCWKVYGCPEAAKRAFSNYEKCRKFLCSRLEQGFDLYRALRIPS